MKSNLITENYYLLSLDFLDEYDEELVTRLSSSYSEQLIMHEDVIPKGKIYLRGILHDSWVSSIECTGHELHIWLNEFSTHCFADAYTETYAIKIPHKKRVMPICLRFVGLVQYKVYRIKRNLKMIPISAKKYLPGMREYLGDELIHIDNECISLGMLFWNKKERKSNGSRLLLQVESSKLMIEEHQPQAFIDLFGSDHIYVFNDYWVERQKGHYFDYSTALSFLNNHRELMIK